MPFDRARLIVPLAWSFASLATALLAHAGIDRLGELLPAGAGADAYDDRAHPAVGPLAAVAAMLLLCAILRIVLSALARRERGADGIMLLARRLEAQPPLRAAAAVWIGGSTALVGMEFAEQILATGHVEGLADALGGNAALGAALVAVVAAAFTVLGLRTARSVVAAVAGSALAVAAWVATLTASTALRDVRVSAAALARRPQRRSRGLSPRSLARCTGLRAPPVLLPG